MKYKFKQNHYILILQHKETKRCFALNLFNNPESHLFYHFVDVALPDNAPQGEYQYALIWDRYSTKIDYSDILLDSTVTIVDEDTAEERTFFLKDLKPDTGTLLYTYSDINKDSATNMKLSTVGLEAPTTSRKETSRDYYEL